MNETKGLVLSEDAEVKDTTFGRMRGLMFSGRKDVMLDSGFDGIDSAGIHMVFMKYPIDVAWVDDEMTVVDVKRGIQPFHLLKGETWRIYKPKKPARYVVELGKGKLGTTEVGDKIKF